MRREVERVASRFQRVRCYRDGPVHVFPRAGAATHAALLAGQASLIHAMPCHAIPFHFIVRIRPRGGAAVVQYKPTSVQRTRTRAASAPSRPDWSLRVWAKDALRWMPVGDRDRDPMEINQSINQ
jgi:hypothetical protein